MSGEAKRGGNMLKGLFVKYKAIQEDLEAAIRTQMHQTSSLTTRCETSGSHDGQVA